MKSLKNLRHAIVAGKFRIRLRGYKDRKAENSDTAPYLKVRITSKYETMLKSIFLLNMGFLIFTLSSEAQTKFVGEISNGTVKLTVDKGDILTRYNRNLLKATGIDGQFTDVNIKTTDNKNYYLVFTSSRYKSSLSLTNLAGKFAPTGTSCTTPDCAAEPHGCEVTYGTGPDAGTVYCSPCGNGGKCTKTSSSTSLIE